MQPSRPIIATDHPRLSIQETDDGSRTLIDVSSGVAFHSASGALAETRHVYFRNSGVEALLRDGQPADVLEVGLGTAMGMLVSVGAAQNASIRYTALESEWLPADLIRQLNPWQWTDDHALVDQYLSWRSGLGETPEDGEYRWQIDPVRQITVQLGPAQKWRPSGRTFDAIFFDPFAPDVDPMLWRKDVFVHMHAALRQNGKLVSYCVSRAVKDALTEAGLQPQTVPGPANGKRDVLVATR